MNIDRWMEQNGLNTLRGADLASAKNIGEYASKMFTVTNMNAALGSYNALRAIYEQNMILIRQNSRIERLLFSIARNTEK